MEGIEDLEAVEEEESFIPGGFFEEDDKIWKDLDAIYGGRTIKNELKYTNEEVVKRVYSLGRTISKVFHDMELHYWTSGGTTLGALRHKGVIPWDDDLDICVLEENENKLVTTVRKVLDIEHEIKMVETLFGYRLFHTRNSDELERRDYRYPFCDIFIMMPNSGKKSGRFCDIRTAAARSVWPKEKYKMTDIICPTPMLFGDFYLYVGKDPETYLTNTYGENWNEVGSTQDYCHVKG